MDGLTAPPSARPPAPCLLLAWGNRSRGDDALGPLLLDRIQRWLMRQPALQHRAVECLEDQQLQVEHLLDLRGRRVVLLIDAMVGLQAPFSTTALTPCRDASITSHALSPQALLQAYQYVFGDTPPRCLLLGLRAAQFGLDNPPTPQALSDLDLAERWLRSWVQQNAVVEPAVPGTVTQ